jgi:hypothetical protein
VSSTFSIAAGAKSVVWGPICLSSAESAVFDFQPVGSSSGAAVVEFSKDHQTWTQVGAQVKNGSTSWATGKTVDLSAESTPWGPVVYIRFNNNSTKDVNIKNLVITATLYTSTALELPSAKSILVSDRYYNVHGQPALPTQKGLLLRRMVYSNGATVVQKRFNE